MFFAIRKVTNGQRKILSAQFCQKKRSATPIAKGAADAMISATKNHAPSYAQDLKLFAECNAARETGFTIHQKGRPGAGLQSASADGHKRLGRSTPRWNAIKQSFFQSHLLMRWSHPTRAHKVATPRLATLAKPFLTNPFGEFHWLQPPLNLKTFFHPLFQE